MQRADDVAAAGRQVAGGVAGAGDRAGLAAQQKRLVYERVRAGAGEGPLMISAEASTTKDLLAGAPFVVANSMREVQPEINVLVSPNPERLYRRALLDPEWVMPVPAPEEGS